MGWVVCHGIYPWDGSWVYPIPWVVKWTGYNGPERNPWAFPWAFPWDAIYSMGYLMGRPVVFSRWNQPIPWDVPWEGPWYVPYLQYRPVRMLISSPMGCKHMVGRQMDLPIERESRMGSPMIYTMGWAAPHDKCTREGPLVTFRSMGQPMGNVPMNSAAPYENPWKTP